MEKRLKASAKQLALLETNHEINICSAGRGSGKTAIVSIIALLHLAQGRNAIIVAPTFRQAKRDNFSQLEKFASMLGLPYQFNNTMLRVSWKNNHITVISGGMGETESVRDIAETFRGATSIHTLIFDEAASLPHKVYILAYATMRDLGKHPKRVFIVGTPPTHETHWLAKLAKRDDVLLMNASAKDNPFIESDYLESLEREYEMMPDDFKRRELHGEFIFSGDGDMAVFNDFHIIEQELAMSDNPIVAGLDISGKGSDKTVMTIARGSHIQAIIVTVTPTDNDLKEFVEKMWHMHHFDVLRYDSTGFGHLLTFDLDPKVLVQPVNFGSDGGEKFKNARALIYARTAKMKAISMEPSVHKLHADMAMAEMKATSWKMDDQRKLQIEDKKLIKKKLMRSPDRLDSICLAMSYLPPYSPRRVKTAPKVFQKEIRL